MQMVMMPILDVSELIANDIRQQRDLDRNKIAMKSIGERSTTVAVGTQLMDLNDDCLLEIIRLLQPVDVVFVAETCQRLKTLARTFVALHKHCELAIMDIEYTGIVSWYARILRNFGDLFTTIKTTGIIDHRGTQEYIFKLLHKYTSQSGIIRFRVYNLLCPELSTGMQALMQRCEELKCGNCFLGPGASIPSSDKCRTLILSAYPESPVDCINLIDNYYPQLQVLKIIGTLTPYHTNNLNSFLERHSSLKKIAIESDYNFDDLAMIENQIRRLDEIHLNISIDDNLLNTLAPLQRLNNLKRLTLQTRDLEEEHHLVNLLNTLASANALEFICIDVIRSVQLLSCLNRFTKLREIKIKYIREYSMLEILPNLKELETIELTGLEADGLVDIVSYYCNVKMLEIDLMNERRVTETYDDLVKLCRKQNRQITLLVKGGRQLDEFFECVDSEKRKFVKVIFRAANLKEKQSSIRFV